MSSALPRIRLLPKTDPRPIRHGVPWIYANQLVMDRRTRAIPAGSLAILEDANRSAICVGAFNPTSKIALRVLDRDPDTTVDGDWIRNRLSQALAHRDRVMDAPFYRLVHAEADGLPGVIIDRFGDVAVVQPNAAWADARMDEIFDALADVAGIETVIKNATGRARGLEGLDDASAVLRGSIGGPVEVPMNGAVYLADLVGGQKTGLFFDQRPNHLAAALLATGQDVLDVFSHVGGFGLAALAKGASAVLAVDSSNAALNLATTAADIMGYADKYSTQQGDAFDKLTALGNDGRSFGVVVCDPPAFAPAKSALDAGLRAYEKVARLATPLVESGGYLVLCSCSHAADLTKFRQACLRGIGRAGRSAQIVHTGSAGPDHPLHPHLAESGYLKAIFFRMLP